MPEPMSLDIAYPTTSLHAVAAYMATKPRLVALRDIARPLATRHGDRPASNDILEEAAHLLRTTRGLVSRQKGARRGLRLGRSADWATLLSTLELALIALDVFRATFSSYDRAYGAIVWRDEIWRDLARHGSESASADKH